MLILNPDIIRFEDLAWEDAAAVALDRNAQRVVEEWSDLGPHQAFADVPERRTIAKVTRRLARSDPALDHPEIGRIGHLVFYTSTERSDASRVRVAIRCVLVSIKTDLGAPDSVPRTPSTLRAAQTLTFLAVSPDGGATDPVNIQPAQLTD